MIPDMRLADRLALYTTIYPGVERFLPAWFDSVLAQTDKRFDIWIGIDELDVSTAIEAMGTDPSATWVKAAEGSSPSQIRQAAIEKMVIRYPAVVFVDSDDLLAPTRVEAARKALEMNDVNACAMRIIDEGGKSLGAVLQPPVEDVAALLPRYNVFGLSNTAYRCEILRRCLPIPSGCVLVDWFLGTRAWTLGATLNFDFECRMSYRQYSSNMARVLPPFTTQQVVIAAEHVLAHYALVLHHIPELQAHHRMELETACSHAKAFHYSVTHSSDILVSYVEALNNLPLHHMWWECVAHQQLEHIWRLN